MSSYVPRRTAPSLTDLNFINVNYGGRNRCIVIDTSNGYTMPNCTGYVHGRWLELGVSPVNLSLANARYYWYNQGDGYSRGQVPRLGAVACWDGGTDGAGHVAIVEDIIDAANGIYMISNSAYNSYFWQYQQVTNNVFQSNYTFQGFIYCPLSFDEDLTDEEIAIYFGRKKRGKLRLQFY